MVLSFPKIILVFEKRFNKKQDNIYFYALTSQHKYFYNAIRKFIHLQTLFISRGFELMLPYL